MGDLIHVFESAVARRAKLQLEAYRLIDGAADNLPGLYVDRFGSVLVAHALTVEPDTLSEFQNCAETLLKISGATTLYLWAHARDPKKTAQSGPQLLAGPAQPEFTVSEGPLKFLIKPEANVNAGLFLDMRELRGELSKGCSGLRVLNTFAFTGSLGIAAQWGGAAEVVQVDLSKGILNWARANEKLNHRSGLGQIRYIIEDARTFMAREERRIKRGSAQYDLIIIDPPSFGSGTQAFNLRHAAPGLLRLARNLLTDTGELIFTSNALNFSLAEMSALIQSEFGQTFSLHTLLPPRADFFTGPENSPVMKGYRVRLKDRA